VVLPKKGKLSQVQREREHDPEFVHLRHQHSAVESAINALEVHGLDRCLDHGTTGFKRYVALAVVARNIQRLGAILRQQEADRQRGPYRRAA
jgi:IS5 family transposase